MAVSSSTRNVLDWGALRVFRHLQAALLQDPASRRRLVPSLRNASTPADEEVAFRYALPGYLACADAYVVSAEIAELLSGLVWTQLVGDLVSDERSALSYFGVFEVSDARGRLGVEFRPQSSFANLGAPSPESSPDEIQQFLIDVCDEPLRSAFSDEWGGRIAGLDECRRVVALSLSRAVPAIVDCLNLELTESRQLRVDPFLLFPRALSYCCYYLSACAASVALYSTEQLSVEPIGKLRKSGSRIVFDCSMDFLGLLAAGNLTKA
jgi:hypothetical protein